MKWILKLEETILDHAVVEKKYKKCCENKNAINVDYMFQRAVEYYQSGQYAICEQICREILHKIQMLSIICWGL